MDTVRQCGCKGRRTCIWCEKEYNLTPDFVATKEMKQNSFVYCYQCDLCWEGWDILENSTHPKHAGKSFKFPGVLVVPDFLTESEAEELISGIDNTPWDSSQSGRRKQNYGPKCNFKKRKLAKGEFTGFPNFSKFVQKKFDTIPFLRNFYVIEQCSLEYDPKNGASIDPHIDDCWIWGERIVTVNILGDSVLTMSPYSGDHIRYNLNLAPKFENCRLTSNIVRIFMPARSVIVLYGEARYLYEHCVLREDTVTRRVCLAYREFTPPYLPGGDHENKGREILEISRLSLNSQ